MSARRQIVAALSEDSMGGIATLHDVDRAERLADAYRAEVLAEVVVWLTKKAREYRATSQPQQADTAALLASKVARGAVRENNLQLLPEVDTFVIRPARDGLLHALTTGPVTEGVALYLLAQYDGQQAADAAARLAGEGHTAAALRVAAYAVEGYAPVAARPGPGDDR